MVQFNVLHKLSALGSPISGILLTLGECMFQCQPDIIQIIIKIIFVYCFGFAIISGVVIQ